MSKEMREQIDRVRNWKPILNEMINPTEKEWLKNSYEKFVMDESYIPNLIKEKIEESIGYNSPITKQMKFDSTWEFIPFNEIKNSKIGFNSAYGPNLSDFSNVCVAGLLRITINRFLRKGDHLSDEIAVINERMDSALAKATKDIGSKLMLPPISFLDNSSSHGPNCFVRDKRIGTITNDRDIGFNVWLVLDKSYREAGE